MTYNPDKIRNIVLVGQAGSGKTSLAEAMISTAHKILKTQVVKGEEHISSTEPEESAREITMFPHFGYFAWNDADVTFADIPGNYNFFEGSRAVLPGIEGAVLLFSGEHGVRIETERLWSMLQDQKIPAIGFINDLHDPTLSLADAVKEIEQNLDVPVVLVSIPIRGVDGVVGAVDLIRVQAWKESLEGSEELDIPKEMHTEIKALRNILIERAAETKDEYITKFIDGKGLTPEEIEEGLKLAVRERRFLPLACGSISKHIGMRSLMDDIVALLPSPKERHRIRPLKGVDPSDTTHEVTRSCDTEAPFAAQVLKTSIDSFSGQVSTIRVLSGIVQDGQQLLNTTNGSKQKISHVYRVMGKELIPTKQLCAGEIGALVKLEGTHTGDTLSSTEDAILYPPVRFPSAGISYAVEISRGSEEKASLGLAKLAIEDPTLDFHRDEVTHELILGGTGQLHLQVALERLKRKYGAEATLKTPRVPYRETIRGRGRAQGKIKKQTGGHGQFANCFVEVEPLPRGSGFQFENRTVGGAIPKQYIPSVEKGVIHALEIGPLGGFPVVDIKVSLVDGTFHTVDSSDYAFQNAGALAARAAIKEAQPVLLEPIMEMEIVVPEDLTGSIVRDVSQRRGRVLGMVTRGSQQVIMAEVPLAEVLDYGNAFTSITSGRGRFSLAVKMLREAPSSSAEKVIAERGLREAAA